MEQSWNADAVRSMDNADLFSYFLGEESMQLGASLMNNDPMPNVKLEASSLLRLDSTPNIFQVPAIAQGVSPLALSEPSAFDAPATMAFNSVAAPSALQPSASPMPKNSSDEDDYDLLPGTKRRRGSSRPLGAPRKPAATPPLAETKRGKAELKQEILEQDENDLVEDDADQRQLKNRDAARLFRQRRKEYLRNLEDDARKSRQRRIELENRVRELENANSVLRNSLTATTLELDLARLRISEQEVALDAARRQAELIKQEFAEASASALTVSPSQAEMQPINIPPVKHLLESLSVEQVAQVLVCLTIIAGILGPSAGIPVPSQPAAVSEVVDESTDFVSLEMEDAPATQPETGATAPAPAEPLVAEVSTPAETQLVQANAIADTSRMHMSNYLHSIDQDILSYFVLTAAVTQRGIPVPLPMRS